MDPNNSIGPASDAVRKLWEKHGIKEPMRFLGFCLSMLPIPVIQQAGQVLDRHLSDKAFENKLNSLWDEIKNLNHLVSKVSSLELSIFEIAKTINSNSDLGKRIQEFIQTLGASETEFRVLSENRSYQEIINSIINADTSSFSAHGGSTNIIANSRVQSNSTLLHATDGSRNYVTGSSFQNTRGSVSMDNITAQGPISLVGSSVGFGVDGSIGFGPGGVLGFGPGTAPTFIGNPNEVTSNCPNCGGIIKVDKSKLVGYTKIQCPHCKGVFPFNLPSV